MTTSVENLVQGWTGPLYFACEADDIEIDQTGLTVTCVLRDRNGSEVAMAGKVSWVTPATVINSTTGTVAGTGTVKVELAVDDLKAASSPYRARFKVTDGTGDSVFFPNDTAVEWRVRL